MASKDKAIWFHLVLLFLICGSHVAVECQKIEHVVALMMENRSFDHILGYLMEEDRQIEGCLPNSGRQCQNPLDPLNPANTTWYPVTNQAVENCTGGPNQDFVATQNEVYGFSNASNITTVQPNMTGFIKAYSQTTHIMDCFPPHRVPALATLAREFAVINRYYCSVPGQTVPNRLYFFSATSDGSVNDDDVRIAEGYPQRTIFEQIDKSKYNRTWSVFYNDEPSVLYLKYPRRHLHKIHKFDQFYTDAAAGNLTNLVFLEPRYNNYEDLGLPSQDQEPPHNVGQGDRLIKSVYEALRASPAWNKTLFVLTYDEHGGFFDHVPPPTDSPSPDGVPASDSTPPGFNFDRLGVRVPMILISPWIEKGLRIGEPQYAHYEHSSFSKVLINLLIPDMPFLTKRDAWAASYDWVVETRSTPRNDCIKYLPEAPIEDD